MSIHITIAPCYFTPVTSQQNWWNVFSKVNDDHFPVQCIRKVRVMETGKSRFWVPFYRSQFGIHYIIRPLFARIVLSTMGSGVEMKSKGLRPIPMKGGYQFLPSFGLSAQIAIHIEEDLNSPGAREASPTSLHPGPSCGRERVESELVAFEFCPSCFLPLFLAVRCRSFCDDWVYAPSSRIVTI